MLEHSRKEKSTCNVNKLSYTEGYLLYQDNFFNIIKNENAFIEVTSTANYKASILASRLYDLVGLGDARIPTLTEGGYRGVAASPTFVLTYLNSFPL